MTKYGGYALDQGLVIVSKDQDFHQGRGPPVFIRRAG
jgi:hypothetical protein